MKNTLFEKNIFSYYLFKNIQKKIKEKISNIN